MNKTFQLQQQLCKFSKLRPPKTVGFSRAWCSILKGDILKTHDLCPFFQKKSRNSRIFEKKLKQHEKCHCCIVALDLVHRLAGRNIHYARWTPIMPDGHLYPTLRDFQVSSINKKVCRDQGSNPGL